MDHSVCIFRITPPLPKEMGATMVGIEIKDISNNVAKSIFSFLFHFIFSQTPCQGPDNICSHATRLTIPL
jgi:hypothetical protein